MSSYILAAIIGAFVGIGVVNLIGDPSLDTVAPALIGSFIGLAMTSAFHKTRGREQSRKLLEEQVKSQVESATARSESLSKFRKSQSEYGLLLYVSCRKCDHEQADMGSRNFCDNCGTRLPFHDQWDNLRNPYDG